MTESEMFQALRDRYPDDAYVLLPHVRDGTGFSACRTADAVAFGLWPSRGLEVEGFEIKCSRNDWLRELKAPEKADAIYTYCDRWWLVVSDAEFVKDGELPPTWGLLVMKGNRLECRVKAPKLSPKEMDRPMFAAFLRQLQKQVTPNILIDSRIAAAREEGKQGAQWEIDSAKEELGAVKESLAEFEKASGVRIDRWSGGRIGAAVKFLVANGQDGIRSHITSMRNRLAEHLKAFNKSLAELDRDSLVNEEEVRDPYTEKD